MRKLGMRLPAGRGLGAILIAGLLSTALGACERIIHVRGNLPHASALSKISPGVHTRADVTKLLGSPSTESTYPGSKWYYIGQKTTEFAFFEPEVIERKVVVVSFDEEGTVSETTVYSLADGQEVDPVDRITPTEGREITFIQQFLGNLGRFNNPNNSPVVGR